MQSSKVLSFQEMFWLYFSLHFSWLEFSSAPVLQQTGFYFNSFICDPMVSLLRRASWSTGSSSCNSQLCDTQHCTLILSGPKPCPANNYSSSVSPYWGHGDNRTVELLFLQTAPICMTISCSIPYSHMNKASRYLNSFTRELIPTLLMSRARIWIGRS